MKNLKFLFLFFLMSCSSSKVIVDYEDNQDFSKLKSFDFYEDNGESLNDFDVKRITNSIQQKLEEIGMNKNENPDVFIYFDADTSENNNNNTIGVGFGSGGLGISGGIPIGGKKLNEKLIIKFIEATTNNLLWEGALNSVIKEKRAPEKRKLRLNEVVRKILSKFPPK